MRCWKILDAPNNAETTPSKPKNIELAWDEWEDALFLINELRASSYWETLVAKGNTPFLDAIAELYFLMALDVMHVRLIGAERPIQGYPPWYDKNRFVKFAAYQIYVARFCRKRNYWLKGYKWQPSQEQNANLRSDELWF